MATQAKVVIKGKNDISGAVKSASKDLSSLKDSVMKLGSTIKGSLIVAGTIKAIQSLGSACKTVLVEDFGQANRSYKQLALALQDKSAYDAVTANIDELCKKTLTANDDIESMVAQLAALGKTPDEINKISNAAVALSNVTGKDLNSAMTTLLGTFNGTTTQLKKLGINLEGITEEELKQGAAIDIVIGQLGAYSDEMAKMDSSQSLKNISETWGDIKEKIGGIIDYNFGPFLANLDTAFSDFGERINSITIYVGAMIKNFPDVFKILMNTLWQMVKRTFEWDSLKTIFLTVIKNICTVAMATIKAIFTSIPQLLSSIVSGVSSWFSHMAYNLQILFLTAIENIIKYGGEKIQGSWVGKLFKFDDKMASFSFDTESIQEKADAAKINADKSFESMGPMLKDLISTAIETETALIDNTKDAFIDIYSDIGNEFKTAINELVSPTLEDIAGHASASNQDKLLSKIANNTETNRNDGKTPQIVNGKPKDEGTKEEVKKFKSIADNIAIMISDALAPITNPSSATGFTKILKEDFSVGIGALIDSIMPLVQIVTQFISPMSILLLVIKGFVSILEPALTTVVQPLVDSLTWLGEMIASLFLPILDQLYVIFALISNILQSALTPIIQSLMPIFQIVGALLEALSPIIVLVAKAFTVVASPIQFVADLLSWLGNWIKYCGHAVEVFCHNLFHPFSKRSYGSSPGSFSSNAFSGLADRLAAIDNISANDNAASDSVSTGTAVSSASYSGATHITINIYQQSPVVGDGGMRTFARMIKNEFIALDYYGVN